MPYVPSYTGYQSPSSTTNTTYTGINKLPIDAEALIIKPDGSGYIGDDYGANIYYFDATKKIIGAIVSAAGNAAACAHRHSQFHLSYLNQRAVGRTPQQSRI